METIVFKTSAKQLLRTPFRTALFLLFLAAVTAFLCFGLHMWVSVGKSLEQTANAFTTMALIEFSDRHAPNFATDRKTITNSPYVEFLDHREWLGGAGEGLAPTTPSFSSSANGIIVFQSLGIAAGDLFPIEYLGQLTENKRLNAEITRIKCPNISLEPGKNYIAAGWYDDEENYFQPVTNLPFQPIAEIPQENIEEFLAGDEGISWVNLQKTFADSASSLTVLTTKDSEIIYAFHQGDAVLTRGRTFSQQEYAESARVCLISATLAAQNNLQLGDVIPLTLYSASGIGWRNDTGVTASISPFSQTLDTSSYEIIGIYTLPMTSRREWYRIDNDTIIVPQDPAISTPEWVMNNLVSCRLQNGTAEAFLAEMEAANIPGISIAIYDQGYSKVVKALTGMKKTALILMGICLAAGFTLSLLFAFLIVGRQRQNVAIMYSLGASRSKALAFLAFTVSIVAVIATVIGGLAGYALSNTGLNTIYRQMVERDMVDTAYSVVATGSDIQYKMAIPQGFGLPLVAAATILFLTVALSAIFSVAVIRTEPLQLLTRKED